MKKREGTVSQFQLFTLLVNSVIATGIFTIARDVGDVAGRGAFISVGLIGVVVFLQIFGMHLLASRFPEHTFVEYLPQIIGRLPAKFYLAVYTVLSVLLAVIAAKSFWFIVSALILRNTPMSFFMLWLGLLAWQMNRRGIVVLARVSEIIFYLTVPVWALVVMAVPEVNIGYLLPIIDRGWLPILAGLMPAYYSMTGFDIFLIVHPFADRKKNLRTGVVALGYEVFVYLATLFLAYGALSFPLTIIEVWPVRSIMSRIVLPVVERVDTLFTVHWTFQVIMTVTTILFVATHLAGGVSKRLRGKRGVDLVMVLFLVLVSLPINHARVASITPLYNIISFIFVGSFPTLLWLIAVIRGIGGEQNVMPEKRDSRHADST